MSLIHARASSAFGFVPLLVASLGLGACASTQDGASASRPGVGAVTSVGAVDDRFRRAGGSDGENIFAQIDWGTPTEVRLGSGMPGPGYWQQTCDYDIDAVLEPVSGTVSVEMTVTYTNNSPHTLSYMWINLEQNLFRGDSIGTNSRTPGSVMKMLEYDFGGGYTIERLATGDTDLEMKVYDTLGRFDLPRDLGPGETIVFDLDFSFPVPPHLRRMGSEVVEQGKIFELAQWFPQVCKYDDVHGWNTLPYLGSGEFYTDFGDYSVDITVPRGYVVSGSGMLTNPEQVLTATQQARMDSAMVSDEPVWIIEPGEVGARSSRPAGEGMMTWSFEIDNARTFAWAASDAFMWDAASVEILDEQGEPRRVLCQSLYPKEATVWGPDHEAGGSTRYIRHSIAFYSDFLFPYPYPAMSNINGPEGGMEYPGIIFCGSRENPRGLFGVTDHEVGHNWFPMVVNSDERRYMWQDEGFNTFINFYSKAAWYGEGVDLERAMQQTLELCSSGNCQPIMTKPDRAWPRWVGGLMYRKTGYGLYLLREYILGVERFDDAFQGYMGAWSFRHPQPSDFFRSMEDGAGADLNWFWRGWFLEPDALDQAVVTVRSSDDGAIVVLDNLGDMVMPVRMLVEYKEGVSEVIDLPVEIWHQTSRWQAGIKTRGRTIKSVTLDPDGLLPDTNRANNRWR